MVSTSLSLSYEFCIVVVVVLVVVVVVVIVVVVEVEVEVRRGSGLRHTAYSQTTDEHRRSHPLQGGSRGRVNQ